MKNFRYFLLIITIPIMFSCQKNNDNPAITALIPLQTGNTWKYVDSTFHTGSTSVDTSIITTGDFVTIMGSSGFNMHLFENAFQILFVAVNDDAGNYVSLGGYSNKDTLLTSSVQYRKEAKKGDSWNFQGVNVNTETGIFEILELTMTCINADTPIITKTGTYTCKAYSYTPNNGADVMCAYISEGVGIIKTTHFEDEKLFSSRTLISYELK